MTGGEMEAKEYVVGDVAEKLRGVLRVSYPMAHGQVNNWEDMEHIWEYIYKQELKKEPSEHPLLHRWQAPDTAPEPGGLQKGDVEGGWGVGRSRNNDGVRPGGK